MPKVGKKFGNLGKNIQKFENILKKGRWLRAIIARNKLLEKTLIPVSNFSKWRKIPYDPNAWRRKSFLGLKFSSSKQKHLTFTIGFWNSFSATLVNHISDRSGCSCFLITSHFNAGEKTFIVRKKILQRPTFRGLKSRWKYLKSLIKLFKVYITDTRMFVFINNFDQWTIIIIDFGLVLAHWLLSLYC